MNFHQFIEGKTIYTNPLESLDDIRDWIEEGAIDTVEKDGMIQLSHRRDAEEYGDHAHWVLWCPIDFPDHIIIEWNFTPLHDEGLCMLFFSAMGRAGEDIFDQALPKRTGFYPQYHSGAINALHLSYYRRKHKEERAFRTCNLRKSHGFHLVAHGADPIPPASEAMSSFKIRVVKFGAIVQLSINDLPVLEWQDNGKDHGPIFAGGKIGFRQMAPMKAGYSQFTVKEAINVNEDHRC